MSTEVAFCALVLTSYLRFKAKEEVAAGKEEGSGEKLIRVLKYASILGSIFYYALSQATFTADPFKHPLPVVSYFIIVSVLLPLFGCSRGVYILCYCHFCSFCNIAFDALLC